MHEGSMMFLHLLLMLIIGYALVGFWLFWFEKRKQRKKAEKYDCWFKKRVKQGLHEEQVGKFADNDSIDTIFNRYIESNNVQD